MSMIGAPSAVAEYEDLAEMGFENFVVFGTCGVLDARIDDCVIILPDKAVRDESCQSCGIGCESENTKACHRVWNGTGGLR